MNILDTRNLAERREALKQEILDSFLENFPHYEEMTESFEDILFEEEEIESWKQDWQEEINQITCIDELEEEISEFSDSHRYLRLSFDVNRGWLYELNFFFLFFCRMFPEAGSASLMY